MPFGRKKNILHTLRPFFSNFPTIILCRDNLTYMCKIVQQRKKSLHYMCNEKHIKKERRRAFYFVMGK